jgi:hypothetical protein
MFVASHGTERVFAHESPPRAARFEAEICLYFFALTVPFNTMAISAVA